MLTVAYLGNFRPAHSTENHIAVSLQALGHRVVPIQEDDADAAGVLDAAGAADMLWWTRTWDTPWMAPVLDELRRRGTPTVGFHLDIWHGLAREPIVETEPFFRVDHLFTADGDHTEEFRAAGINHTWVRPGIVHTEVGPGSPDPRRFPGDVCFVGNWSRYHPEWPYRRDLVLWLRRTYGRRFSIWPRGQAVRGADLNDLYATAKVVVGDSIFADRATRYWSDRVYETVGRAGFMIFPAVPALTEELIDGKHLRYYQHGDLRQLRALIDYYLDPAHARERDDIRLAGAEHVAAHCTYQHRCAEILETVMARTPRLSVRDRIEVRADVDSDPIVIAEVFDENVYRVTGDDLEHGGTVVDIGANIGAFAIYTAALHPEVTVRAFEPEPDNAAALRANVAACDLQGRVEVREQAVGAAPGHVRIYGRGGGAYTGTDGPGPTVEMVSLADALDGLDEVDVLKVDVEGAEYLLFHDGVADAIGRCRRIIIEFHGRDLIEHRRIASGSFGRLVELLAETHHVDVLGAPSRGGMLYCDRY